jgi:hypothetical protein|tara:strand:+ start:2535 stop:2699 length:165 start_codon:yes stop_codon:yes gene_type:complete
MNDVVELWPIISGIVMIAAIGVAFRSEVNVRIKVLEDKITVLFNLFNDMGKRDK